MENENNKGNFWIGFFLGGLFGLVLLFLWGTKEGKKIAKLLAEKGELLEEDIEKKILEIEEKGEELLSNVTKTKQLSGEKPTIGKQPIKTHDPQKPVSLIKSGETKKNNPSSGNISKNFPTKEANPKKMKQEKKLIHPQKNINAPKKFFRKEGKALSS